MASFKIPVWNQTDYLREHVPFILVTGGTGDSVFFQPVSQQTGTDIDITVNGGVLPATDDKIALIAPNGAILPSAQAAGFGWTADRVSTPNKIILDSAPVEATDILVAIAV